MCEKFLHHVRVVARSAPSRKWPPHGQASDVIVGMGAQSLAYLPSAPQLRSTPIELKPLDENGNARKICD